MPRVDNRARMDWNDGLRNDLLDCYDSSIVPERRGYMARMHALWMAKHPEHALSAQHLRDYVSYLLGTNYVRVAPKVATPPQPVVVEPPTPIDPNGDDLLERARLNFRIAPKVEELTRMDAKLNEELPEDADIWTINCAVYAAAASFRPERETGGTARIIGQLKRRISRLTAQIKSVRQKASRIQCVVEYVRASRAFTPRVRRMANFVRRTHHTVNLTVLLNIKQHCLDEIRALVATKKSLVRRMRGLVENSTFLIKFWRQIYETERPFKEATPGITHLNSPRCVRKSPKTK